MQTPPSYYPSQKIKHLFPFDRMLSECLQQEVHKRRKAIRKYGIDLMKEK